MKITQTVRFIQFMEDRSGIVVIPAKEHAALVEEHLGKSGNVKPITIQLLGKSVSGWLVYKPNDPFKFASVDAKLVDNQHLFNIWTVSSDRITARCPVNAAVDETKIETETK